MSSRLDDILGNIVNPSRPAPAAPVSKPAGSGASFTTMLLINLAFLAVVGLFLYRGFGPPLPVPGPNPGPNPAPTPGPSDPLVARLREAMAGPNLELHAIYMAKVCDGVANRLVSDWNNPQPRINTRSEAVNLYDSVGYFAGGKNFIYPSMYGIIASVFDDSWEKTPEGKLAAGALTQSDRQALLTRWRRLAAAFREAGN